MLMSMVREVAEWRSDGWQVKRRNQIIDEYRLGLISLWNDLARSGRGLVGEPLTVLDLESEPPRVGRRLGFC